MESHICILTGYIDSLVFVYPLTGRGTLCPVLVLLKFRYFLVEKQGNDRESEFQIESI